jgi:hypothetical protein
LANHHDQKGSAVSDPRVQRTLLFVSITGGIMFFLALVLLDMFPPPSPGNSAEWWVSFWSTDTQLKRVGIICGLMSPMGLLAMYVVLLQQLKRIEGGESLAYVVFGAGVFAMVPGVVIPFAVWSPLVYRPETLEPHLTQTLSDLGWLTFFLPWPALVQFVALAFAVFRDREEKVFPRWFGYLSMWVGLLAIPGGTILFFKSGVLAWNGLLPWWVALAAALAFGPPMYILLFKTIGRQLAQETAIAVETAGAAVGRST